MFKAPRLGFLGIPSPRGSGRPESLPKGYKPWVLLSLAVLVGSFVLFTISVIGAFVFFGHAATPLWLIVLGVLSVLGIIVGFGGFFLLLCVAGFLAWRESRRQARAVQVIPPQ